MPRAQPLHPHGTEERLDTWRRFVERRGVGRRGVGRAREGARSRRSKSSQVERYTEREEVKSDGSHTHWPVKRYRLLRAPMATRLRCGWCEWCRIFLLKVRLLSFRVRPSLPLSVGWRRAGELLLTDSIVVQLLSLPSVSHTRSLLSYVPEHT